MEDIKPIIAKNITALRQGAKMTQSELAERLNYSDKAVSKWERGESIPDVTVLKAIADLFCVPLDYLVREEHSPQPEVQPQPDLTPSKRRNHTVITTLSVLLVWFVATLIYVIFDLISANRVMHYIAFVYAVPASLVVWLVLNAIWFSTRKNYLIISLLMWSILASAMITVLLAGGPFAWQLLTLGIPGQIIILMWSKLEYKGKQKI